MFWWPTSQQWFWLWILSKHSKPDHLAIVPKEKHDIFIFLWCTSLFGFGFGGISCLHIDGLVQERCNFSALETELCFFTLTHRYSSFLKPSRFFKEYNSTPVLPNKPCETSFLVLGLCKIICRANVWQIYTFTMEHVYLFNLLRPSDAYMH